MAIKWEYRTNIYKCDDPALDVILNGYISNEGWELCGIMPMPGYADGRANKFVFKRLRPLREEGSESARN